MRNGYGRYVEVVEAFHVMLTNYPTTAGLDSIGVRIDECGDADIMVYLPPASLPTIAAGLVEWRHTLRPPVTGFVVRPSGARNANLAVMGTATEDDTHIAVWAFDLPYGDLGIRLDPGSREVFQLELLNRWISQGD
jgi:hypothetical protein